MAQGAVVFLTQGFFAYTVSLVLWKLIRKFGFKHALDDIEGPPSPSIFTGNIQQIFSQDAWPFLEEIIEKYGSVFKVRGLLGERHLFLHDPKALHHILVKDQYVYEESDAFIATNKIMWGDGLLSTLGDQHKKQRKMLNPVFSIAHMREMTPIFYEVANRMTKAITKQVREPGGRTEVDIMSWMSRTALELIGQSGMGYSFDELKDDNDDDPYSQSVKRFGALVSGPGGFVTSQYIYPMALKFNFPKIKRWIVDHWPSQWSQDVKGISDILHATAVDIFEKKKKAIMSGDPDMAYKKDIISILMRANESAAEEDKMTDSEVYGQVATLTFAAMDTTSSALSRILHLLSLHPKVQEKLRDEILEARNRDGGHDLNYDQLVQLPYLDAVCRETLRLFPPLPLTFRTARKDMLLPLSKPITDKTGKQLTEILVPNGTTLLISVLGANCNPEMWGEDAKEWKPERWLEGLPESVSNAKMPGIYSNLMTFLGGSRACIGFKFSQLEMKVVLSLLLSSFKFEDAGKKINWKMTGITAPIVEGGDPTHPSLPIIMTLLEKK